MQIVNKYNSISKVDKFYIVHTNNADIKIYFLTDEIIRIRASFDKKSHIFFHLQDGMTGLMK